MSTTHRLETIAGFTPEQLAAMSEGELSRLQLTPHERFCMAMDLPIATLVGWMANKRRETPPEGPEHSAMWADAADLFRQTHAVIQAAPHTHAHRISAGEQNAAGLGGRWTGRG